MAQLNPSEISSLADLVFESFSRDEMEELVESLNADHRNVFVDSDKDKNAAKEIVKYFEKRGEKPLADLVRAIVGKRPQVVEIRSFVRTYFPDLDLPVTTGTSPATHSPDGKSPTTTDTSPGPNWWPPKMGCIIAISVTLVFMVTTLSWLMFGTHHSEYARAVGTMGPLSAKFVVKENHVPKKDVKVILKPVEGALSQTAFSNTDGSVVFLLEPKDVNKSFEIQLPGKGGAIVSEPYRYVPDPTPLNVPQDP